MFRTLSGAAVVLSTFALSSCLNTPNFPSTPSIEFKEIKVTRVDDGITTAFDHVVITVNFKDGEGDLGLNESDKTPNSPYAKTLPDGTPNRNYNNYFLVPYFEVSPGRFEPVVFQNADNIYISTYPPLDPPGGKAAPLKGDLTFTTDILVDGSFTPIKSGQTIRFELSIMDRALNESNKVVTSSYLVQ
ncbi:hypothetical protein [Hymenobacter algoricola]